MIRIETNLADIKKEWQGVESMQKRLQLDAMTSFAFGSTGTGWFPWDLSKAAANLVFILACSALNDLLIVLEAEKHFTCKSKTKFLGPLFKASKKNLPWQNYTLIEEAIQSRNDITHKRILLNEKDCSKFTDAIKQEFISWGIIAAEKV